MRWAGLRQRSRSRTPPWQIVYHIGVVRYKAMGPEKERTRTTNENYHRGQGDTGRHRETQGDTGRAEEERDENEHEETEAEGVAIRQRPQQA